MISRPKQQSVYVVDAQSNDYTQLMTELADEGLSLDLFHSAGAALRLSAAAPDLWVVNMNLPDMSGADLVSMLRGRHPGVPIFLVSDEYRVEDEINARVTGAEAYLCKPLCSQWLSDTAAA